MIEEKSMSEQRKIIHDDNNGLDYVLVGDYYIPMLALPEENSNRQIMMRSDIKLLQPFASWSNSL